MFFNSIYPLFRVWYPVLIIVILSLYYRALKTTNTGKTFPVTGQITPAMRRQYSHQYSIGFIICFLLLSLAPDALKCYTALIAHFTPKNCKRILEMVSNQAVTNMPCCIQSSPFWIYCVRISEFSSHFACDVDILYCSQSAEQCFEDSQWGNHYV